MSMFSRKYKPLQINIELSDELKWAIDSFLNYINHESGSAEDCYRSEIHFWLKDSYGKLSSEDYEVLKSYYVHGGIYAEYGYPYEYDENKARSEE